MVWHVKSKKYAVESNSFLSLVLKDFFLIFLPLLHTHSYTQKLRKKVPGVTDCRPVHAFH